MGIDVGSVSLNIAIIDEQVNLLHSIYQRTKGQPIPALLDAFNSLIKDFPKLEGVITTGSGRELIADILGITKENEIMTQAKAVTYFHPGVRTVNEINDSLHVIIDFLKSFEFIYVLIRILSIYLFYYKIAAFFSPLNI